jgi:tetraacyldisaccharide 4'-kinase
VPVGADPCRHRAARALLAAHPEVTGFVLDDGFQHRQVYRDVDLVLIDATDSLSREHLLPRGFLREPAGNLRRASAVIVTRADAVSPAELAELDRLVMRLHGRPPLAHAAHRWTGLRDLNGARQPVDALRGRKVLAVCGIGNPAAFAAMVAGATAGHELVAMADHHAYTAADLAGLARQAREHHCAAVVTTEKDWMKWAGLPRSPAAMLGGLPVYRPILAIELLDGQPALTALLRVILRA